MALGSGRTLRLLGQGRLAWIVAAALLFGVLGFALAYFRRQPVTNDARVTRFSILPPEKTSFGPIAVSPDGRHLAFMGGTGGKVQLWVHAFDSNEDRALPGTQGAAAPFWSPDGRFIGFFADAKLKKIEVTGASVETLCDATIPRGGAWNRDGVILFGQAARGLLRISATGGEVTQVTTPDSSRQEGNHISLTFLPDGRHFLYYIVSGQKETRGVYLGSLDGTLKTRLLEDSSMIKYMPAVPGDTASGAGWLLFGHDDALMARPFDTSRLEFTGEPFKLLDKLWRDPGGNYRTFSISNNGVLVFHPNLNRFRTQYRWVDRRGQTINSLNVAAGGSSPWLSPDEKLFIADRLDPQSRNIDLWLCEISGSKSDRFTFDSAGDIYPVWSPDGRRIVWASTRGGAIANLYQKAVRGAGEETLLWKSDHPKIPTDWSRDGRFIIYYQNDPKRKQDVWVLPMTGSDARKPFPVVQTDASETAGTLSHDGRGLVFASNVSGRFEVHVLSFPDGGGKRQGSNGGGGGPRWRRDGRELFYYSEDRKLMAVQVRSGESFEVGATVSLFEFRGVASLPPLAPYSVTAGGQRFLINESVDLEPNAPLTVVVNWAAELKK